MKPVPHDLDFCVTEFSVHMTFKALLILFCSNTVTFCLQCVDSPLSSDRQHLSCGVCLEVRGEIIRTVLCCIVYDSCAQL